VDTRTTNINLCIAMTCDCRAFELERKKTRNKRYASFEIAQEQFIKQKGTINLGGTIDSARTAKSPRTITLEKKDRDKKIKLGGNNELQRKDIAQYTRGRTE